MKAISLFSNCGAGDVGYRKAGFEFKILAELDANRLSVALANHPKAVGVPGDLRETWPSVVRTWRQGEGDKAPDLLAACPPCQGMSSARSGLGSYDDHEAGGRDARNLLVTVIAAVAKELKPRMIVVENVPAFLTRSVPHPGTGGPISAALLLVESLADEYMTFSMVADLADWGVPQSRKRAFLTLVRRDEEGLDRDDGATPFPRPTHADDWGGKAITLKESLKELSARPLDASDAESAADSTNALHFVPVWNERQYRMIQAIPPRSGKGAWSNEQCSSCSEKTSDLDAATCVACGKPLLRPVVREMGVWRLVKGFRSSSYARMRVDVPAATITTASGRVGSDNTIHPWENRTLSPYECAHIQTIPPEFDWNDALLRWGHTSLREMIGEAVPPRFTALHGIALKSFLGKGEAELLPDGDVRVQRAVTLLLKARSTAHTSLSRDGNRGAPFERDRSTL